MRLSRTHIQPATVVILSGVVAALHIGKLPPAIPVLQAELGMTLVEAGFLLSMVQMAGMLVGVLVGLAADGFGLRRSLLCGLGLLTAGSFMGALAQHPGQLLALRALEGMGVLMVALPAPSLIRQHVPAEQLASRLGLWGAYMPTGTALALLVGPVVLVRAGWTGWWIALALLTTCVLALAWWALPGTPQACTPNKALRRCDTAEPVDMASARPLAHSSPLDSAFGRLGQTLTTAGPWLVALAFAMYSSQWLAVVGFLPAVYGQAGVSAQLAGVLTAGVCAANITGNVAAGRLIQRGMPAKRLLSVGFLTMGVMAFIAFHPVTAQVPTLRYLAVVLFSAVGGVVPGTLFSRAVALAPSPSTVSTTVGWMQQCSSTGQFVGPPLVAWVAGQVGGWHWTWAVTGAAALAGLLLVRRLPDTPPHNH